jgi:ABC-2 type transport system permease protein
MSGRSTSIMFGVAKRHLKLLLKNPELSAPPMMMPLFFFVAFAGGLSAIANSPDFDYPDYTGFVWVFVLIQAAAFAGVFTGTALAEDFDTGFASRMMLAAPQRMAIVMGYVLAALVQAVFTGAILFGVAVVAGMDVSGSVVEILGIFALALLFNVAATLAVAAVGLRLQSVQAAPLMQIPVFVIMFLTPVYTVRDALGGWLQTAASVNPVTPLMEASRGFLAGEPVSVGLAFACGAGMIALFGAVTLLSLRWAEAAD